MENDMGPIYKFFKKWSEKQFNKMKTLTPVDTGRLKKSLKLKMKQEEKKWSTTIEMIYYGIFVDEGTRYIEPRHFTKPITELDIKEFEVEVAKYTEVEVARFIEDLNKNKR